MHSGRTVSWAGEIEDSGTSALPTPARHRKTVNASGPLDRHANPELVAGLDPGVDTTPTGGLHTFDLGMVPASVTPPRTWRRAAWFAIASSAAALGGLVFAMAAFVGGSSTLQGLDLPSMPRGGHYPPLSETDSPPPASDHHRLAAMRPTSAAIEARPPQRPLSSGIPAPGDDLPGQSDPTEPGEGEVGTPGDDETPTSSPEPSTTPPTTEPPRLVSLSDTEAVKERSGRYFDAVARGDLASAYALTTGSLRDEGYDSFAARYADATTVEVMKVYVKSSSTITTVRITRHDGQVVTQRRELRFTIGNDPMIRADEVVD